MALFSKAILSTHQLAVVPQRSRLDVACIERSRDKQPRVTRCESYPLEGGLTAALARLRQGGKLDGRCTTLLAQGEYQFLAIEAPSLPESAPQAELREAVRWQIKDMVDFPVNAAGVDALRIPAAPGRAEQLLVVAASHAQLKPRIESFQNAKVDLVATTLPEIAQRNIAQLFETPDRALALLTFNEQGGLLTLTCNGELHAIRRLDVSALELASDKSTYERALLDVQRSLDNFDRNFSHLSLQRLLVLPVPAADDFIAHLRDNLYQPVEALVISDGLDISTAPMLANAATLADALPALGAALEAGSPANATLNLFDPALQQQHDPWSVRNLAWGVAASVLLCALLGGWAHWQQAELAQEIGAQEPQLQAARSEVQQLTAKITGYKPDPKLQAELDEFRTILQARSDVLALLKKGLSPETGSPAEWLRGFARQIPNGLWLTAFQVNADNGALEIHGRTIDPALIPEYVRRLNAEQAFQGRTFTALEITGPGKLKAGTTPAATNVAVAAPAAATPVGTTDAPSAPRYHEFALTSSPAGLTPNAGGRS